MTDLATAFTFLATPGGLGRRISAATAAQNPDRPCRGDPECGRNLFKDEQQRAWRCGNCRGVYHRAPRSSSQEESPASTPVRATVAADPAPSGDCACCRHSKRGLDEATFQMLVLFGLLLILVVQIVVRK